MKKIWLIRHGESRAQTGEDEDWVNPALTERGQQQAMRLVEPLKTIEPDRILVSPLARAWRTLELSEAKAPRVEFDSRLIESDWGVPHCYQRVLPMVTPAIAALDNNNAWDHPVDDRAAAIVAEIINGPDDKTVLFGHWGVFNSIFRAFVGFRPGLRPIWLNVDNAAISLLEVDDDGNRIVQYWNNRAHMQDLPLTA